MDNKFYTYMFFKEHSDFFYLLNYLYNAFINAECFYKNNCILLYYHVLRLLFKLKHSYYNIITN